jgi:hypothetical protein
VLPESRGQRARSINPEFTMCGAVQPKLFGFPLAGSAIEVAAAADKTSMAGQFSFSSALFMGSYAAFFPIGDQVLSDLAWRGRIRTT